MQMAPSPENDDAPKTKLQEASVSGLDDVGLKALLDEAISYKTPKDRLGKSELFQNLLEKAEEDDRKARATSASGKESVRYYNTTAKHRTRRRREASSVSENLTHGGSLNNLAEDDLYAPASHLHRLTKPVSTRQRQGGSLPCNVNTGLASFYDKQFFEEAARKKVEDKKVEHVAIEMESESLLAHDSLNQDYTESEIEIQTRIPRVPTKFTSRYNLDICGGGGGVGVDDGLTISALERTDNNELTYGKAVDTVASANCFPEYLLPSLASRNIVPLSKYVEDKKVDENGNALSQNTLDGKKNKKKKLQTADKNVVVLEGKDVVGHRSDIVHDVDKIMEFLGEQCESKKANEHRNKTGSAKKQRTRSKGKSEKMQKSNSMEEISVSTLDEFNLKESDVGKVPLRGTKSNVDRPRERRSWGNSESLQFHASAENLESSDFRVVTKKKKSKKRRQHDDGRDRMLSPEPRRKSVCSAPHSDKSNDSSDVDSVHSLPIDAVDLSLPISYADIAKHDRPKWNRPPSERRSRFDNDTMLPDFFANNNNNKVKSSSQNWQGSATAANFNNRKIHNKIMSNNNNIRNVQQQQQQHRTAVDKTETCVGNLQVQHHQHQPILPRNIPDVQTIEQMHFKQLQQAMQNSYVQYASAVDDCDTTTTTTTMRTSDERPAVVILSDNGNEVSGLTFGFEINEQLLSDDVCDSFTARFYVPDVFQKHNHDKIVNFVGLAWEDALNGKAKYFSEQL